MASAGKELEQKLLEAGKNLISPPSDSDELLQLLDQAESILSKVNQSPPSSMAAALHPIMKAIVAKTLLRHSNDDVKIYVASCLSEITRITAPDAPYDDELMKEIFGMIVEAFKGLDCISGSLFSKRLLILETVAKVRSCLVMLDLECDKLVLDMFHHFFYTISEIHPERVFNAMETIMTLVLEESEDISSELVSCLLESVKKDNKKVLPIARSLGEKVIGKCASQLKPSLVRVIRSCGADLTKYSKIVADICRQTSDGISASSSDETLDDDSKLSDKTISEELPQKHGKRDKVVGHPKIVTVKNKSSKSVMSNGTFQMRVESSSIAKTESRRRGISKSASFTAKIESENLVSVSIKALDSSDQITKKRGRKKSIEKAALFDGEHNELKSSKGDERNTSPVSPILSETRDGVGHRRRGRPPKALVQKEYESKSDSELKSTGPSEKKIEKESNDERIKMKQKRKLITGKGGSGEQIQKSEAKTNKNQNENGESSKTKSKGKHSSDNNEDLDEEIVGARIKVWWPDDKRFYHGVIESFDPITKKHTVLYADGDVEVLRLKKERWEYVDKKSESDEEKPEGRPSPDPHERPLKKAKTSASKQTNMEAAPKSSAGKRKGRKAEPSGTSGSMGTESTGGLKGEVSKRKKKSEGVSNDVLETAEKIKISSSNKPEFETPEVIGKLKHEVKTQNSNSTLNVEEKSKDEDSENDNKSQSNAPKNESKYDDASITSPKAMYVEAKSKVASDVNDIDNTVSDSRDDTMMAVAPSGSANKVAEADTSVPKTATVVSQENDGPTEKLCSISSSADGSSRNQDCIDD